MFCELKRGNGIILLVSIRGVGVGLKSTLVRTNEDRALIESVSISYSLIEIYTEIV